MVVKPTRLRSQLAYLEEIHCEAMLFPQHPTVVGGEVRDAAIPDLGRVNGHRVAESQFHSHDLLAFGESLHTQIHALLQV